MLINQPLVTSDRKEQLDITCSVTGGLSGQVVQLDMISKALVLFEPELKDSEIRWFFNRDLGLLKENMVGVNI